MSAAGMVRVPGGTFRMGSDDFYVEERPTHDVDVEAFWIDQTPVTVAAFGEFVTATGYVTTAEHAPSANDYPDADPDLLVPGSLVFHRTEGPVPLDDYRNWWSWVPGADWRHPEGPASTARGREQHPVTHVAYADAAAYAEWVGKRLPTEAEWECAARGGLDGAVYTWGNDFAPDGRMMANTWQGEFPWQNLALDQYEGTSPVGAFPANGYGAYDMAGNVWEWTTSRYTAGHQAFAACCSPKGFQQAADGQFPRHVIKGGSHLCAANYCLRYRPAARQGETIETSTCHLGFRCVVGDAG
jgi:formylglycine-generating enzyme